MMFSNGRLLTTCGPEANLEWTQLVVWLEMQRKDLEKHIMGTFYGADFPRCHIYARIALH